ncbi:hypothetical protein ACHAXM_005336 [Skeletonema potamos]|jgi:hypothetical protein
MKLLLSIILFATTLSDTLGFASLSQVTKSRSVSATITATQLGATQAETEAERLLRKARELREASQRAEDTLHANLIQKKKEKDAATDLIISQLFPSNGIDDLVDRLRKKRLASDMLVRVVERLHEREIAARGLEHVEPSLHHDQVTFKRVAQPDKVELAKIEGIVNDLVEAAAILDQEWLDQKHKTDGGKITHAEIMHWGGGKIAGILQDKIKELGREQDEQFKKRLQSFYDAANRKKHKDAIDGNSWREDDVWKK